MDALLEHVELAHFLQWVLVIFEKSVVLVFRLLCLVLHSLLLLVMGFFVLLHAVYDFIIMIGHVLFLLLLGDSIVPALYPIFSHFNFSALFTQIFKTRISFGQIFLLLLFKNRYTKFNNLNNGIHISKIDEQLLSCQHCHFSLYFGAHFSFE